MDNRQRIVTIMQNWVGAKQGDAKHHQIIDTFNTIGVGRFGYSDPWCAMTTSAAYKMAGLSYLFPSSASCGQQIEKAKKMGIWVENDAYVPSPGDSIIYAWNDPKPKEDNTVGHDHTGIIEKVVGGTMTIIEGNMVSKGVHLCGRRTLSVNGKNIRGFIIPLGASQNPVPIQPVPAQSTRKTIKLGDVNSDVIVLHQKLWDLHYGVDRYSNKFTELTHNCVLHFQASHALEVDGICGPKTWAALG